MEARLEHTPRFRRRLAFGLPGMGEPFWVDDEAFDIARHVVPLCDPDDRPDRRRFHALCDRALSEPLDRTRPLWRVYLAPKLADGGAGMVAKIHHALVDGKSAVEVALLLFDVTPGGDPAPAAPRGGRSRSRGPLAWPWGRSRGAPPSRCAPRAGWRGSPAPRARAAHGSTTRCGARRSRWATTCCARRPRPT